MSRKRGGEKKKREREKKKKKKKKSERSIVNLFTGIEQLDQSG